MTQKAQRRLVKVEIRILMTEGRMNVAKETILEAQGRIFGAQGRKNI